MSLGKDEKPENQSPLTRFSLQAHGGQETGQWGISRVDNRERGQGQGGRDPAMADKNRWKRR